MGGWIPVSRVFHGLQPRTESRSVRLQPRELTPRNPPQLQTVLQNAGVSIRPSPRQLGNAPVQRVEFYVRSGMSKISAKIETSITITSATSKAW
jgi:hypothetical protein